VILELVDVAQRPCVPEDSPMHQWEAYRIREVIRGRL
jgi:hypothetical protein